MTPRLAPFALAFTLAACGGYGSPVTPGSAVSAADALTFAGAARKGISAHYVVESGTNADGRRQLSVRFVQARSMLDNAKPLTGAKVRYPDGSMQGVDSMGLFDAGASSFAVKHGQNIKDLKGVVVRIIAPSATAALKPTRFALYVPSAKEEARETSYYRGRKIGVTFRGGGLPCEPTYRQKALDPDAVIVFPILLTTRQGVVEEAAHSCDRGDPDTQVRIVGLDIIASGDLIRWNYYYQAPSRDELKAAGITQAREYLQFRVPTLYPVFSPRYVTQCGAQGC